MAQEESHQPVPVPIYCNCAIVKASFHDVVNMHPQNITVRLKFSVHDDANCGTIAVIARMTIMDLFDEYPAPFSSGMMIVIDHNVTPINVYT